MLNLQAIREIDATVSSKIVKLLVLPIQLLHATKRQKTLYFSTFKLCVKIYAPLGNHIFNDYAV